MIKLYGIPTCGSVRNARKFFKESEIEIEFIDFRKTPLESVRVKSWVESVGVDILFNNRGTTYRKLKLKDLNLDAEGKQMWLCDESMLLKRPIIEFKDEIIVGFDEEKYVKLFK